MTIRAVREHLLEREAWRDAAIEDRREGRDVLGQERSVRQHVAHHAQRRARVEHAPQAGAGVVADEAANLRLAVVPHALQDRRAGEVEGPLFLRKFGVPFWALAHVFGNDPMFWYRLECGLGRFRVVATTVRQAELPKHLLADEHHQPRDGQKTSLATTVADGCCLGAEPAEAAGTDDLKAASEVFRDEARDIAPKYAPETVNTDGWKGTQAAWKALFPKVVILLCFVHAWLKVRDRAKHLKEVFADVSRRVWEADHAPDRRRFAPRLRSLRQWASPHLTGIVLENVLDLCSKRDRWSLAYRHPEGHRTSHMLDRQMRGMNRSFDHGQHLHGSREACRLPCRAWALLWNFAPWHPATTRKNQNWRCPAERLNQHRYHDCWLQNLLISASLGGYRCPLLQNP